MSAVDMFFGSLLFIIVSSILLLYAWTQLRTALETLPIEARRVIYNVKNITDRKIKRKAELISALHLACILLGTNTFFNAFLLIVLSPRIFCVAPSLLDFQAACNLFSINNIFFFTGFYALVLVSLVNFIAISKGQVSPLLYVPPTDADERIKEEYSVVFKAGIGLSPELLAQVKKLPWWKRQIDWGLILGAFFALFIGIFGFIKAVWPPFPDWPQATCVLLAAIFGLIFVLTKIPKR